MAKALAVGSLKGIKQGQRDRRDHCSRKQQTECRVDCHVHEYSPQEHCVKREVRDPDEDEDHEVSDLGALFASLRRSHQGRQSTSEHSYNSEQEKDSQEARQCALRLFSRRMASFRSELRSTATSISWRCSKACDDLEDLEQRARRGRSGDDGLAQDLVREPGLDDSESEGQAGGD